MPNENVYGPGGLLTTTEDLLRWTNFFISNKLGSPGLLSKQLALNPIIGGAEPSYAAALVIGKYKGLDIISHTGQTAGYIGFVETLPALHLSVAFLSNSMEFRDSLFAGIYAVDDLFINTPPPVQQSTNGAIALPASAKGYAGWYSSSKTTKGIEIVLKHDTLFTQNSPLIPLSETEFGYGQSAIKFDAMGSFTLVTGSKVKTVYKKELAVDVAVDYLQKFAGTYYSKETESSFNLMVKDGKLVLNENYLKDVVLSPTYNKAFNTSLVLDTELWPVAMHLLFEGRSKGAITGCQVSMDNARKIAFTKVK